MNFQSPHSELAAIKRDNEEAKRYHRMLMFSPRRAALFDGTNENVGLTAITKTTTEVLFPRGCLFVLQRDQSLRCSFVL